MITLLPSKVKLLHFPRSHLSHVTHAIIKSCFFQDITDPNYFFSFTENAYEISIVASKDVIDNDFILSLERAQCKEMQSSNDIYRILQVDDEGGQESSGKRISDISGPLAESKFSIFYMSTYQTDFVLIKERKLRQAIQLLQELGFEFDMDSIEDHLDHVPSTSTMPLSTPFSNFTPPTFNSTIITNTTSPIAKHAGFEEYVLSDELQCVGLNPHYSKEWAMTLLKILSYSELIPSLSRAENHDRFLSYTASNNDISLIANQKILDLFEEDAIFKNENYQTYRVIQVKLTGSNLDRCGIIWSISHPLATEAHINLLYLSTFKSANVLVPSSDLVRAEEILDNLERGGLAEVILEP
ncbi:hypothetical protein BDB01DRAFT_845943 [Pilobolus umbonatus]|nr:hypothetical protein BDB01DRAFT_845943 [Pilobolus umbonatus]